MIGSFFTSLDALKFRRKRAPRT